ncbi:sugar transferase [Pseudonocardia sp. KRD-169]|uniref:Sugar transferase n=1 Tax=Pseudonocardia abyssalis TaxID=2792008 RepID=A0ABS6UUW6_9PSEU|nr:sugar transferase [Pseudonocardia abyssalis]MBW0135746.1 sugar transferase [Pseudonocardia abyssalis]
MTAAMQTATVHHLNGHSELHESVRTVPTLRLVENPAPAAVDTPLVPGRAASGFVGIAKMVVDVTATALLLLVVAPVLLVVALAVKADGGPVFFLQTRIGRDGRTFRMVKFRSMVVDAEKHRALLAADDEGAGPLFKMRRDPRITRVGGLLRRYSIDELPQLFNVLNGSMSLIGPRPPLPQEAETYTAEERRRLSVRPGMTGLWQVSGRSDLSWDESIALDLRYVDEWSLRLEMQIVAGTARAVLGGRGAY